MIGFDQFPKRIQELLFNYLDRKLSKKGKAELDQCRDISKKNEGLFQTFPDPERFWAQMGMYISLREAWRTLVKKAPELKGLNPEYEKDFNSSVHFIIGCLPWEIQFWATRFGIPPGKLKKKDYGYCK
jgi:hypothetical protein